MSQGNPYADPRSGSRYLPGYQRQVVGVQSTGGSLVPDLGGAASMRRRFVDDFWRNVDKFTGAAVNVAATYYGIREERDTRDTEVLTNELIRQRKLEVFMSKTGYNADNLLEEENDWQNKTREEVIKQSGLSAQMAGAIWDNKAQPYMDRVGAFMLEQNRVAEDQSKFAFQVDAQNDLALSVVGDFRAYAEYSAKMDSTYGAQSQAGIKAKAAGIDVLVDSWSEQNPQGTLQWFKQNRDGLKEVLGREFVDVANAMQRVENRITAQINRAEAQANRDARLSEKAQKAKDKEWQSDIVTKIITDEDVNITDVLKAGAASGVSGGTLLEVQKIFEGREKVSTKSTSSTLRSTFQGKATMDGLTDGDREAMTKYMANGQLLPADYQALMNADQRTQKAKEDGLSELRKGAMQNLRTAIAPRGVFAPVNQTAENTYERAAAELDKYVDSLNTPNEKRKALDITDPNSYVSQLINLNAAGITPTDRARSAYSTAPFDPNITIHLPESQMRKDGESYADWKKRTGGQ